MWRGGARRRGGRGQVDAYLIIMAAQLVRQIAQLERKPPVTLSIIAGCVAAYYSYLLELPPWARPPPLSAACLQPSLIVRNRQWRRLLWSAALHADEQHLLYNAASFLYKGVLLEPRLGSLRFAGLLLELLLLSHGLVVVAAAGAAAYIPEWSHLWSSSCAVGLSAVIFALKVVLSHDSPGYSSVLGLTLPTKYLAWAELILASALNPRVSFLGHLCGIVAGLLHVHYIAPAAARGLQAWRRAVHGRARGRPTLRPSPSGSSPAAASPSGTAAAATAAAAAAAAQQRIRTAQQRGVPASRARGGGGDGADDARPVAALTADELRQRRLQRFGGPDARQ